MKKVTRTTIMLCLIATIFLLTAGTVTAFTKIKADFCSTPTGNQNGLEIEHLDTSEGNPVQSSYVIHDESLFVYPGANVTHVYSGHGYFWVDHTVWYSDGSSSTISNEVYV